MQQSNKMNRDRIKALCIAPIIFIALCFVSALDGYGDDGLLFLSTSPLQATVRIDGSPQIKSTPMIIRHLMPGEHVIEIMDSAHITGPFVYEINGGSIGTLHFDLVHNALLTDYSASEVLEPGQPLNVSDKNFRKTYDASPEGGAPVIITDYPGQRSIALLNIAIPVFVALSGLLTVNDAVNPKESGLFFSPLTLSAYTATLGLTGYRFAWGRQRKKYFDAVDTLSSEVTASHENARKNYEQGQAQLAQAKMDRALYHYTAIVERQKDSIYMPYALYKIAKIHMIGGELALAAAEFERIVDSYPLPDLYDKSLKSLADIYAEQGRFCESISYLDEMIFADPLFSRESIERYRKHIAKKCARSPQITEGIEEFTGGTVPFQF
jgi:hypothetical protein